MKKKTDKINDCILKHINNNKIVTNLSRDK